jgi:uncharacterized membrane protein
MANNEIKWLYDEMPGLVEKGIISEDTMVSLKNHYGVLETEKPRANLSFILTAIIGAVLISAGIIAIIAHNWDNLGRTARTVITLMPLLLAQGLYGYAFFKKNDSAAWMESTAAFLSIMVLSSLALISQTYNLGGNLSDLLLVWSIIIFPLIYIRKVFVAFLVLLIAITWRVEEGMDYMKNLNNLLIYAAFIIAMVPYLWQVLKSEIHFAIKDLIGWSLILSTALVTSMIFHESGINETLLFAAICSFYYLAGLYFELRPFKLVPVLGTYILVLLYTYSFYNSYYNNHVNQVMLFSAGAVMVCLSVILGIINLKNKIDINPFPALSVLIIALLYLLHLYGAGIFGKILSNGILLGYGIYYIRKGLISAKISQVNLGLLFIAVLALVRFFESDLDFILKGTAFIVVGLGFLSSNVLLNRQLKKNEN